VPVLHDHGQSILDVKIDNRTDWRKAHWNALQMNYGKAPFFGDFREYFEDTYAREWDRLVDINMHLIEQIIKWLGITTKIVRSSAYHVEEQGTERLVSLCRQCQATMYLAGADGKNYMDVDRFKESHIGLEVQDYRHPVYAQQWTQRKNENFISHMSVIDLLFNYGPESLKIL
jgi:hypothetical protein